MTRSVWLDDEWAAAARSVWLDGDWAAGARSVWLDGDWLALGGDVGPPVIASTAGVWWADDLAVADGDPVSAWADRINANSAASSSTERPTFDADGLGGKPALIFDGANDHLTVTAPNAVSTSTDGCVVVVMKVDSPASDLCPWATADTSAVNAYLQANHWSSKYAIGMDASGSLHGVRSTSANVDTGAVVVEWSSSDTAWTIRKNNAVQPLSVEVGANNGGWFGDVSGRDNFTIGCLTRTTSAKFFDGAIAYVGVFDAPLSISERSALYEWISSYYGITIPGVNYIDTVLADTPAAFWECQDASGGLVDQIGGKNASEYGTGAITYQTAGLGGLYAVEMPGTGNKAFAVPDNDLWSSTSFTAEALVYLDPSFGTGQRFWISKHQGTSNYHEWFGILYSGTYKVYNQVTRSPSTADYLLNDAASGLTTGAWHHLAITYDDATTTLTSYVNGVVKATDSTPTGTRQANSSGALYIGSLPGTPADEAWKGRLSCVAFYDRALSGAEVLAHYGAM